MTAKRSSARPRVDATSRARPGPPSPGQSLRALLLVAGVLVGAALVFWSARSPTTILSGPDTLVRIEPATQTVSVGSNVTVEVRVDNVTDLGGYEFHLAFDPNVLAFVSVSDFSTFITSTGRSSLCVGPNFDDLANAIISFAWLPYSPATSSLMIAIAVAVIWSLTVHGLDLADAHKYR